MRFHWRTSETDPQQKLYAFDGLDHDLDETPVAMFRLRNGHRVGLSMEDIGTLVSNHTELLASLVLPPAERILIVAEQKLAFDGASEMALVFREQLDERLKLYTPEVALPITTHTTRLLRRLSAPTYRAGG